MEISLFEPRIPQNTGSIARTCAAFDITLNLIEPLGFKLEDKYLKRAGLDYWDHIKWEYFPSIDEYCLDAFQNKFHLLTTKSKNVYTDRVFTKNDIIIFGSETAGISENILNEYPENACTIPMINKNIRSLNLATSVGIVLYEAIRQINEK